MKHRSIPAALAVLLISAVAWGDGAEDSTRWPAFEDARAPAPDRMISGQPTPAELVEAKRAGVTHVINARDIGEFDAWDESALVEALGMTYHQVPIGSTDDLNREAVRAFDRTLAAIGDEPALLHCASGNRIGALYALRAAWVQGRNTEEAVTIGEAHGLTGLASTVRKLLEAED